MNPDLISMKKIITEKIQSIKNNPHSMPVMEGYTIEFELLMIQQCFDGLFERVDLMEKLTLASQNREIK